MDSIRAKQKESSDAVRHSGVVRFADAQSRVVAHHSNPWRAERFARSGFRTHAFYTEDSGRYVTPVQRVRMQRDRVQPFMPGTSFDTINARYSEHPSVHWRRTYMRRLSLRPVRTALATWRGWWHFEISPVRAWNLSLVGAMLFGMISMAMIYRSFGQPVFATEPSAAPVHEGQYQEQRVQPTPLAATARDIAARSAQHALENAKKGQTVAATIVRDPAQAAFEKRAREMVKGYPIEKMLPELFKQDRTVAAFMIAMAKQESQWGKRVPVLNGKDCYNYWGFRAKRARMGTGGHTCFDSRRDAVETVARRVHELVYEYKRTTAAKLIVWKCGYSCQGHNPHNVASWKRTVQMYYDALVKG